MSENSNLKNFITKLNDRNLQRKRESGITSYVLFSVLIFCSYKLYKNLSFYLNNDLNFILKESTHLICFVSNSLIAIYFIFGTFQTEKKPFSNLKVVKYDKKNFNLFNYIILLFLLLIPIVSTVYSYLNKNVIFSDYYYYYLGFLNLILILILIEPITSSKKQLKIINSTNENVGLNVFVILISTSVIIFSQIQASEITINEKFIFIKIIVLFYIILFILEKIVEQEKNDVNTFNLENFEYEIYLKNLNDEQIRERLQENYIGYLIEYWIDFNKRELKDFKEIIQNKKIEIDSQLFNLEKNVDERKYPIEFSARKEGINESLNKVIEFRLPSFKKMFEEVTKIINEGKNLNEIELKELNQLKTELNLIIKEYNCPKK